MHVTVLRTPVLLLALAVFYLLGARSAVAATELLFFFSHGCEYCEQWEEEVGSVYAMTDEARVLPLRRVDTAEIPAELVRFKGVHFTPTFIAVHDGREVGRLIGYIDADFFWGYLAPLVEKAKQAGGASPPRASSDSDPESKS